VVSVFNPEAEAVTADLSLNADLHLPPGETYLVYDFWQRTYLGETTSALSLTIEPFGSRVVSIRRKLDVPQIVSTSRHITQGAYDLVALSYDQAACCLSGRSKMIEGEDYVITFRVPAEHSVIAEPRITAQGGGIYTLTIAPDCGGEIDWRIEFQRG